MKHLLLALAIGLTAMGCRDRETEPQDQLPPITQHGANTAGCLVNGKVIIPKNRISDVPGSGVIYGLKVNLGSDFVNQQGKDKFTLYFSNRQLADKYYVELGLNSTIKNTNYNTDDVNYIKVVLKKNKQEEEVYISQDNSGTITINEVDINLGIISGTFTGRTYNKDNPNEICIVEKGRFDININTLNK